MPRTDRHVTADVSPEVAQRLYQGGITLYRRQVPALAPITEAIAAALVVPVFTTRHFSKAEIFHLTC